MAGRRRAPLVSIGIQGGRGSFNDRAIKLYLARKSTPPENVRVEYLYTTDRVLNELRFRRIDLGQFAVANTLSGVVEETRIAQVRYSFDDYYEVVEQYSLKIVHCLMHHPEARLEDVDTIMTHPQAYMQCRNNIAARYPWMKWVAGKGDSIDPAVVGKAIASGALGRNVATVSDSAIADIHGLEIADPNLQDGEDNFTTFVLVKLR